MDPGSRELERLVDVRDAGLLVLGIAYLGYAGVLDWQGFAVPHEALATFVVLLVLVGVLREAHLGWPGRLTASVRAFWPVLVAPMVYLAEARVLEVDQSRYVDGVLAAIDGWMGLYHAGQPLWPIGGWVEELANAAYASYYVIPFAAIWLTLRRGPAEGARVTAALVFASLTCGTVWLLWPSGGYFPLGGPMDPAPGPFTAFVHHIYASHPHYAAAFPSEHVAHAAALAAVLRQRGTGRWVWLWVGAIAVSTVIGQYHYAADGVAGALVGLLAAAIAARVAASVSRTTAGAAVQELSGSTDRPS